MSFSRWERASLVLRSCSSKSVTFDTCDLFRDSTWVMLSLMIYCLDYWDSLSLSCCNASYNSLWFERSVDNLLNSDSWFALSEMIVFIYASYLLFQISDSVLFWENCFARESFSPRSAAFYLRISSTLPSRSLAFLALKAASSKSVLTWQREVSSSLHLLFQRPTSSCCCPLGETSRTMDLRKAAEGF